MFRIPQSRHTVIEAEWGKLFPSFDTTACVDNAVLLSGGQTISTTISKEGWNLFARVLEEILAVHGYTLSSLVDGAQIHPEKVHRLQQSLDVPHSFPVLQVDEMERVSTVFHFTAHERMRLEAALLTTFLEAKLMNRISAEAALHTAECILPILEQAVQDRHPTSSQGKQGLIFDEAAPERLLESALMHMDQATLDLHMSRSAEVLGERLACTREAQASFETALAQLEEIAEPLQTSTTWQLWYQEAKHGYTTARGLQRMIKVDQEERTKAEGQET